MGGEPPWVSNIVKMIKSDFLEFKDVLLKFKKVTFDHWAKIACGNISSQAFSACLAESKFEGCVAQKMLPFRATVLLGGHLFEIH